MANLRAHPELGVAGNRPPRGVDRCFETNGTEIAPGDGVWNGILDAEPAGACTLRFPLHRSSRIAAGGPIEDRTFECALHFVDEAIGARVHGA